MWQSLSENERKEYKKMILAFASLTEMFAQKAETDAEDVILAPIINSKYQETVFQKVFNASAEDIGNTSYDAAIRHTNPDGSVTKYLVGIKTFGVSSGDQKIAQFKAYANEWSDIINQIRNNAVNSNGEPLPKEEINKVNEDLYLDLAVRIATLRNMRIDSSVSNLHGFSVSVDTDDVKAVYHVLMPSKKGEKPLIYVGETNYDKINIDQIEVIGCTQPSNPANFEFSDGSHKYRYTSADSQLLMNFDNKNIIEDQWEVKYAEDAYEIFADIADRIYKDEHKQEPLTESYSWLITNEKTDRNGKVTDEVEMFSGFNAFYGVGSKLGASERPRRVQNLKEKYVDVISEHSLNMIASYLLDFLTTQSSTNEEKRRKVLLRDKIMESVEFIGDDNFKEDVIKLVYRPSDEMYIPLPNSVKFHQAHKDFFAPDAGLLTKSGSKWVLAQQKDKRKFNLVFEPSGDTIEAFIAEDGGKAIESYNKQTIMGDWILRKVFQLGLYEPLTTDRLNEIGINGIRLSKTPGDNGIHLQFIWIDKKNLPDDYIK